MMRALTLFALIAYATALASAPFRKSDVRGGHGGGVPCAACTIVVADLADALRSVPESDIDREAAKACALLRRFDNGKIEKDCLALWSLFGPTLVRMVSENAKPDAICQAMRICTDPKCTLYDGPPPSSSSSAQHEHVPALADRLLSTLTKPITGAEWPWQKLTQHKPFFDADGDTYSTFAELRGSDWRGRDCDDGDATVYPGRRFGTSGALASAPSADNNCNGIPNADEDRLCGSSDARGLIVIGDSASAHFHLNLNLTLSGLVRAAMDELDAPYCSWGTGFMNASDCPLAAQKQSYSSLYERLRKRNRCNHNDFENISVNGARSTGEMHHDINATTRNIITDKPALVVYALVGNDICTPHPDFSHMTSPTEFHEMVTDAMKYLEGLLPKGSHVVLLGLESGGIWDLMADKIHPALQVPYSRVWEYTDCLQVQPCWGWLNPSKEVRENSTALARTLSGVLESIAATESYDNFDILYLPNPEPQIVQDWIASGHDVADLFEWVGGGHPSQIVHDKTADYIWNALLEKRPDFVGPENPNNVEITKMYGKTQQLNPRESTA